MSGISWARAFGTGLLGKARALFHGLGRPGEHPSRKYDEIDGWLFCVDCHNPLHGRLCYFRGWLAWHLVCKPWPVAWGLPPFLATAGDCIFDCRSCRHDR